MRPSPRIPSRGDRVKRRHVSPAIRMHCRELLFPERFGHFVTLTHTICPGALIFVVTVSGGELFH